MLMSTLRHYANRHHNSGSTYPMIFAYIDPGAGSMVIQAVIAGIIAVPFFFRTRIRGFVQRVRNIRGNDKSARDQSSS
jgi:hypothetical protein